MLFNSYEFVFFFLPITAIAFYLLGSRSKSLAIGWLILASLAFYAWWRPLNVALIAPSILINYGLSRWLMRLANEQRMRAARAVLVAGIAFNVVFLGYFKYANFLVGAVNDVAGTSYALEHIILPLGISFITFQKIAFLVDVAAGRVKEFTLRDYCLFVLFFPQLIAGPIVHYREVMPQFHSTPCRFDRTGRRRRAHAFFRGTVQESRAGGRHFADGFGDLCRCRVRSSGHDGLRVDGRHRLYIANLFRFLRLLGHGRWDCATLRSHPAGQFQFAAARQQHHRFLAALAPYADALPDGVYLQSVELVDHAASNGQGTEGCGRPEYPAGCISSPC